MIPRNTSSLDSNLFDVVVVGGGIHGACIARDASRRGLKVALLEKDDFGSGTSHNSLKIIHGGIRYLQHLNFSRTIQSIKEQAYWFSNVSWNVDPIRFLMPLDSAKQSLTRGPLAMKFGFFLYQRLVDLSTANTLMPPARVSKPPLSSGNGVEQSDNNPVASWYDAQVSEPDRVLLLILADAAENGAIIVNHTEVVSIEDSNRPIKLINARDKLRGLELVVKSHCVINATGPWMSNFLGKVSDVPPSGNDGGYTVSCNIVVNRPANDYAFAFTSSQTSDSKIGKTKRQYFSVPWKGYTVLGTTYKLTNIQPDELVVNSGLESELLAEFNRADPELELSEEDLLYVYQGLTPVAKNNRSGVDQLQHSEIIQHDNLRGILSVQGVKWTTARLIAQQTVDRIFTILNRKLIPGDTRHAPLLPEAISWGRGSDDAAPQENSYLESHILSVISQTQVAHLDDYLFRRTDDLILGKISDEDLFYLAQVMKKRMSWSMDDYHSQVNRLITANMPNWRAERYRTVLLPGT